MWIADIATRVLTALGGLALLYVSIMTIITEFKKIGEE
jgi:hypothetical protein